MGEEAQTLNQQPGCDSDAHMQQRKAPLRDAAIPVEHVVRAAVALHTHTLNPLPRFGGCLVVGSALSWGFEKGRMRHKSSAALAGPTAARSMSRVRLLRYCCFGRPNSQPPRFLKHQLSLLVVDATGCVALPHSHSVFSFLSCPYTHPPHFVGLARTQPRLPDVPCNPFFVRSFFCVRASASPAAGYTRPPRRRWSCGCISGADVAPLALGGCSV